MSEARAGLNGSGPQTVYINTYRNSQDYGGNYSNYRSYGIYEGQNWGSWTNSTQYWSANLGGVGISGTFTIPSPGKGSITLYDHWFNRYHDGNGYGSDFNSTFCVDTNHSTIGDGCVTVYEGYPPRIPKRPSKPNRPDFISASATTIEYYFYNSPDNGGSGEIGFDHQSATDPNFTQNLQTWGDAASPGQAANLIPGTTHYIHYRSTNAYGSSDWSDPLVQTTLPAVPPGFKVASSPSGTEATLTFSPPGGVTGVTKYVWERRLTGTTTPVASGESTGTVSTVGELIPGNSYDWRAGAYIGQYLSPLTAWTTLVQAKPNINPGDYFDGATADTPDLDYGWSGVVNGSTSRATAKGVAGWEVEPALAGAAVLFRVTAGLFSSYSARMQVKADTTAAGQIRVGQTNAAPYWTEVTPTASYVGSIYVRPSRAQHLAAEVTWMVEAGGIISTVVGTAVDVASGTWTRLLAGGVAPAGAKWAVVRIVDVAGGNWAPWHGGDVMDLDGAMISLNEVFPYFDGSSLYDGTYVYEWTEPELPHASPSTRTPIEQVDLNAMVFGGGPMPAAQAILIPGCTVPPPPRPPSIPSDCVEDVGVWRRYSTAIPAQYVPEWLTVVPTLEVTTGSVESNQVRLRFYANPDNLLPAEVDTTSWVAEQIIAYLPANTVLTLDGITQRVWAEVNGGDPISADHLLYGTNGKPATWPLLSCGIAYLVTADTPIDEPSGNVSVGAALTVRT